MAARGGNVKRKKGWRGVGGEGAAPPPQMHPSDACVVVVVVVPPQMHPSDACVVVVVVVVGVVGVVVVVLATGFLLKGVWLREEATLKEKKGWRGVGGEGAAPPPQMHPSDAFVVVFCCGL